MADTHMELRRGIDSIRVGRRHRTDLGDLDPLIESIRQVGLLQPITITPDGTLVCGARRLAALKTLGETTVAVWIRPGVTTTLTHLLAEQDDNRLHKPLTGIEAANLYAEMKELLAADARHRQEAARFPAREENPWSDGAAPGAAPGWHGDTRAQAAQIVTGRNSYAMLERINELQRIAADPAEPDAVRAHAAAELARIDAGGSTRAALRRTQTAQALTELDRLAGDPTVAASDRERARTESIRFQQHIPTASDAELERLAAEALARVSAPSRKPKAARVLEEPVEPARYSLRGFILTWRNLTEWWTHYDPAEIGNSLTDEIWDLFTTTLRHSIDFYTAAATARCATPLDDMTVGSGPYAAGEQGAA